MEQRGDRNLIYFSLFLFAVYKKHHPPVLFDEVWRLEKIGKDGAFHKRLSRESINTVKDFLTLLVLDPSRLRHVRLYSFFSTWYFTCLGNNLECIL